jgi:hypothetical protein
MNTEPPTNIGTNISSTLSSLPVLPISPSDSQPLHGSAISTIDVTNITSTVSNNIDILSVSITSNNFSIAVGPNVINHITSVDAGTALICFIVCYFITESFWLSLILILFFFYLI